MDSSSKQFLLTKGQLEFLKKEKKASGRKKITFLSPTHRSHQIIPIIFTAKKGFFLIWVKRVDEGEENK